MFYFCSEHEVICEEINSPYFKVVSSSIRKDGQLTESRDPGKQKVRNACLGVIPVRHQEDEGPFLYLFISGPCRCHRPQRVGPPGARPGCLDDSLHLAIGSHVDGKVLFYLGGLCLFPAL